MAISAERISYEPVDREAQAIQLTALPFEQFSRAKAERFIGIVTVGSEVAIVHETGPPMSLLQAIPLAREGDPQACAMVRMNVKTDLIERSIKKGHVTTVRQQIDANGESMQNGQSGRSIHANSLRFASTHPKILPRTKAETRNKFRIEDARRQGLLKDHYVVVASRPPDDMSEAEMHAAGFFVDTMSIAFQATTEDENSNELITESAFVAGKRQPTAVRHDKEFVRRVAAGLNLDIDDQNATEGIDRAWLVPKHLMPNGVIDLVRMGDARMGTFFGDDQPRKDYLEQLEYCRERERALESTVDEIYTELLATEGLLTPLDATQRLHVLSEAKLVQRALHDQAIDLTVLGAEAAHYVSAARHCYEIGDFDNMTRFMHKAKQVADTNSCAGGGTTSTSRDAAAGSTREMNSSEDGDCEFTSKECPLCKSKNVKTVITKLPSGKKRISGSCGCTKVF